MIEYDGFLSDLSVRLYLRGDVFRHHQDLFVAREGADRTGLVLEVGGERAYDLRRFFPRADRYLVTNVRGDADVRLDLTHLGLADASQDTVVCVSVLEHVDDLHGAVAELARVVRPGGIVLLTVPFLYPVHDTHDVWRVTPDAWPGLLGDRFEVGTVTRLGGRIATLAMLLQRPRSTWTLRYAPQKLLGLVLPALGRWDQPDDAPMGVGIVARRV